ncbi:MAG TPA: DUF883 C-terminal domain-containing protein [Bacteroidia bacterium]|nr:DUF883 C-terminal domain-containing protein [Bacteroidia bacterium]
MSAESTPDEPELFDPPPPKKRRRSPQTKKPAIAEPVPMTSDLAADLPDLRALKAAGERFVREQPLLAMGLAAGIGYLIGRLKR